MDKSYAYMSRLPEYSGKKDAIEQCENEMPKKGDSEEYPITKLAKEGDFASAAQMMLRAGNEIQATMGDSEEVRNASTKSLMEYLSSELTETEIDSLLTAYEKLTGQHATQIEESHQVSPEDLEAAEGMYDRLEKGTFYEEETDAQEWLKKRPEERKKTKGQVKKEVADAHDYLRKKPSEQEKMKVKKEVKKSEPKKKLEKSEKKPSEEEIDASFVSSDTVKYGAPEDVVPQEIDNELLGRTFENQDYPITGVIYGSPKIKDYIPHIAVIGLLGFLVYRYIRRNK